MEEGDHLVLSRPDGLRGAHLSSDTQSHTGTENLIMAAALALGTTVIDNTALEPEVLEVIALPQQDGRADHRRRNRIRPRARRHRLTTVDRR